MALVGGAFLPDSAHFATTARGGSRSQSGDERETELKTCSNLKLKLKVLVVSQ